MVGPMAGCTIPAIVFLPWYREEGRIFGEVFLVGPGELKALNRLKGYYGPGCQNYYERVRQTIFTENGRIKAYVYIYPNTRVEGLTPIGNGDWTIYNKSSMKNS